MDKKYKGIVVPMVTPLTGDGTLDHSAVTRIVEHLAAHGASPFVLGTTGEGVSLGQYARKQVVEAVVRASDGKVQVYAGLRGHSVDDAVVEGDVFFDSGVDAVVATPPCYYPATQSQLADYYTQLADALPGPLVVYNIPATTGVSIALETVDALADHQQIVGFKDSENNSERVALAAGRWKDRPDFSYFLGWAAAAVPALSAGADGIVPSAGNLCPGWYRDLLVAVQAGDLARAEYIQQQIQALSQHYQKGFTLGESLAALKVMMSAFRLCGTVMAPPLQALPAERAHRLISAVKQSYRELEALNDINYTSTINQP